jgi:hypothetical protein
LQLNLVVSEFTCIHIAGVDTWLSSNVRDHGKVRVVKFLRDSLI